MADDKDATLAQFQAVVPGMDTAMGLSILEATNWDLNEAINVALATLPEPNGLPADAPAAPAPTDEENPWEILRTGMADPPGTSTGQMPAPEPRGTKAEGRSKAVTFGADTANGSSRGELLSFDLHFQGRLVHLPEIPPSITIGALMERIGKAVCALSGKGDQIKVSGWMPGDTEFEPPRDIPLGDLGLSGTISLTVSLKDAEQAMEIDPDLLEKRFKFSVQDLADGGSLHKFALPGAHTLDQVKTTVRDLTNILPSRQLWMGFPDGTSNDTIIAACPWSNIDEDTIILSVDSRDGSTTADASGIGTIEVSSDDDDDDAYPSSAHNVTMDFLEGDDGSSAQAQAPLIPAGLGDEPLEAIANFQTVFESRFPSKIHPDFFHGTLGDALAATSADPTRERRPMAVYLHNDAAVAANIFCEQVLCSEQVSTLLSANFVLWPWDITQKENADLLLTWVAAILGESAAK